MSTECLMNPDFLIEFIEMYRSLPCLWRVKSSDYSNRQKKAEAYDKLLSLCKSVCPTATLELVKNKIANLRTVFKKELKKVEASVNAGASGEEIYIPRLWYFDLLKFTIDQDVPTPSMSRFPDTYEGQQEEDNTDDSLESTEEGANLSQVYNSILSFDILLFIWTCFVEFTHRTKQNSMQTGRYKLKYIYSTILPKK